MPCSTSERRRVLLLIDSLGAGGAQRQICELGVLLKEAGFDVGLLLYHEDGFFLPTVAGRIRILRVFPTGFLRRSLAICRAIKAFGPEAVISYLEVPSIHAELAALFGGRFRLIVSERNLDVSPRGLFFWGRTLLHLLADAVVSNSHAQTAVLHSAAPWLRKRLRTIPNVVDLQRFRFAPVDRGAGRPFRILIAARYEPQKNGERLVAALRLLKDGGMDERQLQVTWHGNHYDAATSIGAPSYRVRLEAMAEAQGIGSMLHIMPPAKNIDTLYPQYDAFCLPSLHEGCPNVIAEAMACGRPILAGKIVDNARFVFAGRNGWLFDPTKAGEIAAAVRLAAAAESSVLGRMGKESRLLAESYFGSRRFVAAYVGELNR